MKIRNIIKLTFFIILLSSCRAEFDKKVTKILEGANKLEIYFCEQKGLSSYRHLNNIKLVTVKGNSIIDLKNAICDEVGRGSMAASFAASIIFIFYDKSNKVELAIDFPRGRLCLYSDIYPPVTDPSLLRPGEKQREYFQFYSLDSVRGKKFLEKLKNTIENKVSGE